MWGCEARFTLDFVVNVVQGRTNNVLITLLPRLRDLLSVRSLDEIFMIVWLQSTPSNLELSSRKKLSRGKTFHTKVINFHFLLFWHLPIQTFSLFSSFTRPLALGSLFVLLSVHENAINKKKSFPFVTLEKLRRRKSVIDKFCDQIFCFLNWNSCFNDCCRWCCSCCELLKQVNEEREVYN